MALQLNVNSYVTVSQADEYFTDRVNADEWHTHDHRDGALVTATSILNSFDFKGEVVDAVQPLLFPRIGDYYDDNRNVYLDFETHEEFIRSKVDVAVMELAFHLILNPDLLKQTGTTGSAQVGDINLSFIRSAPLVSSLVYRYLGGMLSLDSNRHVRVGG